MPFQGYFRWRAYIWSSHLWRFVHICFSRQYPANVAYIQSHAIAESFIFQSSLSLGSTVQTQNCSFYTVSKTNLWGYTQEIGLPNLILCNCQLGHIKFHLETASIGMENKNFMTITYNFMNYDANRKKAVWKCIYDHGHNVLRIMTKFKQDYKCHLIILS